MIKRVFIIHAWDESSTSCWYPWLKHKLEANGYEVTIPTMPNPEAPDMDSWIETLNKLVPDPDNQTYFVGHSIGCQAILRCLAALQGNQHIAKTVLVAPW